MSTSERVSCGLLFPVAYDIAQCLHDASVAGYDFICLPLIHPWYRREFFSGKCKNRKGPFTRSDMLLSSRDWTTLIVGAISQHMLLSSEVPEARAMAEAAMEQELSFSSHLGIPAVLIRLFDSRVANLASILLAKFNKSCCYQAWIQVPILPPSSTSATYRSDLSSKVMNHAKCDDDTTWGWWNTLRTLCNYDRKLGVALEITSDLPSNDAVDRWLGEPVRCLIVPTSIFLTNQKGFPVLSRPHQHLIKQFVKINVQLVVSGADKHGSRTYQQYLHHLWNMPPVQQDPFTGFAKGFEDYLQNPLQPLHDDLESQTYEVFEKDPIKYSLYQSAVYECLLDKIQPEEMETKTLVIMLLGAGRGPLVKAILNASESAKRKVKVYAVEKNPNAVLTLQALQEEVWGPCVEVVHCDMRTWDPPEKADVIVSELLGSFADNELSPECLDGAQKCLKDDGVSIPSSYTSYIGPVQCSKIYNELLQYKEKEKVPPCQFETPYVVHLHNRTELAPPQPLFTFHHPNKDEVINNTRYEVKRFQIQNKCVVHGIAGYFETTLYKNVFMSINPATHTKGMFSWFPIFFPSKEPLQIDAGEELEIHFWRRCSPQKVWYEWAFTAPRPATIHNPSGRSYTIGL